MCNGCAGRSRYPLIQIKTWSSQRALH
jgi:hypothetical protein